jgi:hypothetical protein
MAKYASPEDTNAWKAEMPKSGVSSGQQWSEWAKKSPNREAQAEDSTKETKEMPTTMTRVGTPEREAQVAKWKKGRPVSGKGGAKTDEDKEEKRQSMIEWAKWNPNRGSNARRTKKEEVAKRKDGKDGAK